MHNERYLSNASVYRGPCYPIFPRGVLIRLRMIETKKDAVRLVYRRMCQASSFPIPFGQLACFFPILLKVVFYRTMSTLYHTSSSHTGILTIVLRVSLLIDSDTNHGTRHTISI
jgi:hypothetical protein